MAGLKCNACGSNEFFDQGSFLICEFCGTRYPKSDFGVSEKKVAVIDFSNSSKGKNVQRLLDRADMQWRAGNKNKAISLYRQVLELDPDNEIAKKRCVD